MASFDLSRWFAGLGAASTEARAREQTPEADARVRQAIDNLPVTLFEFDANGIYTAVAGRYVSMFGISPAQILGRSVFDFPKLVPGKNMMVRRALKGEAVSFHGIWPLGRFMIRFDPCFDAQGKVTSVVGLGFELGKLKTDDEEFERLLQALRQSEARFRAMCESAPLGIYVSNERYELGYVNPALCAMLDRTPEELLGRHWEVVLHPDEHTRYDAARNAGPPAHDGMLRLVRKDGSMVWTSTRTAEMRDDGEILGYVGAVADVTREHAARLAADGARMDLRQVIESSPEGIAVVRDGRFVFVNRALLEGLGYVQPAQLLGQAADELVHPADRLQALALASEPLSHSTGIELRYRKADSDYALLEVRPAVLAEFEGAPAVLLSTRDITERKKLQAQLLVSERLLSVGTLAAGVAHEINNPLAALLSNLEWVSRRIERLEQAFTDEAEPRATPSLRDELETLAGPIVEAREAAERVRGIVRDLKLFSRAEEELAGPVDLRGVLDSAARMAWNEVRHRARFIPDYGDLPPVHGSEARLGQVFLNLIINAAQAIPEGHADQHEIRLSARAPSDEVVVVEVSDSGSGIPPEVLGRIFDPFFTTKPPTIGTGLGLSICHRLVTSLGGRIEVESQPGQGSVFRVTLLAADGAEQRPPVPERRSGVSTRPRRISTGPLEARRGRVLVIDDDAAMAKSIELVLADHHEVEVHTSARRALARLEAGELYDSIVCDVMMPEMTGIDFHAEVSRLLPQLAPQIIFMTGGAFTVRAREFLDRVENPRLDKPFDSDRLLALIARQIARRPSPQTGVA